MKHRKNGWDFLLKHLFAKLLMLTATLIKKDSVILEVMEDTFVALASTNQTLLVCYISCYLQQMVLSWFVDMSW